MLLRMSDLGQRFLLFISLVQTNPGSRLLGDRRLPRHGQNQRHQRRPHHQKHKQSLLLVQFGNLTHMISSSIVGLMFMTVTCALRRPFLCRHSSLGDTNLRGERRLRPQAQRLVLMS